MALAGYERDVAMAALIGGWGYTAAIVITVGVLWLVLGRGNHAGASRGPGLSASWWGSTALICFVAGVGGLVKGLWGAALFLIPGLWAARKARTRAREGNF